MSIAGVSSGRVLPGYPITVHHSYIFSTVSGLVVWLLYKQTSKQTCQPINIQVDEERNIATIFTHSGKHSSQCLFSWILVVNKFQQSSPTIKWTWYNLLHLERHLISISILNLFGLFSTERVKRDLKNLIIDWDLRKQKWHSKCNRL